MRRTVPSLLRERPPKADDVQIWAQEVIPAIKELQTQRNQQYEADFTHTTEGTAAFETAWTSDALPGDGTWRVKAEVQAFASADGSAAYYEIIGVFKRTASGSASQVGATAAVVSAIEDVAGWDVQFTVSGNTVLAQVKGDATRDVDWQVTVFAKELV